MLITTIFLHLACKSSLVPQPAWWGQRRDTSRSLIWTWWTLEASTEPPNHRTEGHTSESWGMTQQRIQTNKGFKYTVIKQWPTHIALYGEWLYCICWISLCSSFSAASSSAAHHTHLFPQVLASISNGLDTMRSGEWISLPWHHCSSHYTLHWRGIIQTEGQKVAKEEKRALFWSWDVGRMQWVLF